MADTVTNYVTQINVDGTICEIKDAVARTDASSAKSTAATASTKATNALNKVTALEKTSSCNRNL